MAKAVILNFSWIFSLLLFFSCKQPSGAAGTPIIKMGTGKIMGRIAVPNHMEKDSIYLVISVMHPVSGENVQYKAFADQSGRFSIDVDVETETSFVGIYTEVNLYKTILIKLKGGGVTNINIVYNADSTISSIDVTPTMSQNDMIQGMQVIGKIMEYTSGRAPQTLYNKSTDYFLDYVRSALSERLAILNKDTLISNELKTILSKDYSLNLYSTFVFDYEKYMLINYNNTNGDQSKKPEIQKIDRSYFRFLKDFGLNDLGYLYCFSFPEFQKQILQNETLGLPEIGEIDVPTWLAKVKTILADLVGFRDGQYYDILAANAYGRQLTEEIRPLSEKQKKNIAKYWKNGEIAKILMRKNQQVVELDKLKSPTVVNDISSVPKEKVIEAILSKYPNKVVFIDLWATWCVPCLSAMQEFRKEKNELHGKDIVFVYLTNGSSPKKLWEEKIKGIGNEHYYLNSNQWEYNMDQFGFDGIPSYLLYNKQGKLINKFTGFPGNEDVREMINGLL